jgi:hypothetical protein
MFKYKLSVLLITNVNQELNIRDIKATASRP